MPRSLELQTAIDRLHEAFGRYPASRDMCCTCYTPEEQEFFYATPVREIRGEKAHQLLCESYTHMWTTPEAYKYHVPCILESLAPPDSLDDLYPIHLAQTLHHAGFADWPANERGAVIDYLEIVTPLLGHSDEDLTEWLAGKDALATGTAPPVSRFYDT